MTTISFKDRKIALERELHRERTKRDKEKTVFSIMSIHLQVDDYI